MTTPPSDYSYAAFFNRPGATIAKIEKGSGEVVRSKWVREPFGLPMVTQNGTTGGLSADGGTLVLVRSAPRINFRETTLAIADTERLKLDRITLDGAYSFDAISPDGRWMYLIEYPDPRDPYDYSVRAYDLQERRFRHAPIVDPSEPDEAMTGSPLGRVMSTDGRWAYTLYAGGEEPFIHALDTVGRTAVCIDLPQIEHVRNIYMLALEPSDAGGLVVLNRDKPAALVDTGTFEVTEPEAEAGSSRTDEGDGPPWLLIGVGVLAVAALTVGVIRRRRRASVGSEQLEALVRVDDEDRDAVTEAREKEREPVP